MEGDSLRIESADEVVLLVAAACGDDDVGASGGDGSLDGQTITVYSGRGEDLIGPLVREPLRLEGSLNFVFIAGILLALSLTTTLAAQTQIPPGFDD